MKEDRVEELERLLYVHISAAAGLFRIMLEYTAFSDPLAVDARAWLEETKRWQMEG